MNYFKKSIWKWVLLYIIIGAIACGLIYYFFFYNKREYSYAPQNYQTQNQNSQIADWETYKNNDCGFELQIPNGWSLSNVDKEAFGRPCEGFGFAPSGLKDIGGEEADLFLVSIENYNFDQTAKDMIYLQKNGQWIKECLQCEGVQAQPLKSGNLYGLQSEENIHLTARLGTVKSFQGFLTDGIKSAKFELTDPDYSQEIVTRELFDHIISTFKFTK